MNRRHWSSSRPFRRRNRAGCPRILRACGSGSRLRGISYNLRRRRGVCNYRVKSSFAFPFFFVGFVGEGAEYVDPVHGIAVATDTESLSTAEPSLARQTETPLRLGYRHHLNRLFHTHEDLTNRDKVGRVKKYFPFLSLPLKKTKPPVTSRGKDCPPLREQQDKTGDMLRDKGRGSQGR